MIFQRSKPRRSFNPAVIGLLTLPAMLMLIATAALAGQWLPGDTHSHISPPDVPPKYDHAKNDLDGAIVAARKAGLKWLIITPHAMHMDDPATGRPLHELMAAKLAARKAADDDPLVILGWERTRKFPGDMTVSFMNLAQATKMNDEQLFDLARRSRGLLIAAHPYFLPTLFDPADRSWKPWTGDDKRGREFDDHLTGLEIRHSGSPAEMAAKKWDQLIARQKRRIIGVGATDDHEGVLFPTTWVYIDGKLTAQSLREALINGRIVAGGNPQAGSLTVTSDIKDDDNKPLTGKIGDDIKAHKRITINWKGEGRLYIDGRRGEATRGPVTFILPEPDSFHWLRLEVGDDSYANPIYINLPAPPEPAADTPPAAKDAKPAADEGASKADNSRDAEPAVLD